MLQHRLAIGIFLVASLFSVMFPGVSAAQDASPLLIHRTLLDQYCVACHNQQANTAGLALDTFDLESVTDSPEVWEKVILKLGAGLMPPQGAPRPDGEAAQALVTWLETTLDEATLARPDPGRASLHRLNRTEYGNAVRDLLDLRIDVAELLPADDEGYGFDNIADILRVSPSLLEQYLVAARRISSLAVGDTEISQISSIYRVPPDRAQTGHVEGLGLGTRGGTLIQHNFPLDAEYDFSVFLMRNIVGYMKGLEWPHELEVTIDGERVFLSPVGGDVDNLMSDENFAAAADTIDERLKIRVPVTAGPHDVGVAFIRKNSSESHEPLQPQSRDHDLQNMNGVPLVDYVDITGPFAVTGPGDTPSRQRIFVCQPSGVASETACAMEILSALARRAYRRPLASGDLALLLEFYEAGRERGGFEAGVRDGLQVILASPEFLFRSESDPSDIEPGTVYPLDDIALASRLSFFLWSSIPDDELLQIAEEGRLGEPSVLESEVRRMLADFRADAMVENFAGQWLFLRNLQSVGPDTLLFPAFDDDLRRAFRSETELLVQSVMREDRNVLDLLRSDYSFVNERLARHYGIPNIYGSHFRRVTLDDEARRGLLGHGSILTVTSYPNRTSPVLRGKWILENILGTPPPPPPPNVPDLEENRPGEEARSLRERLEQHRSNPACASCHAMIDPAGLALENFDAIGRMRTTEEGGIIDTAGRLVDGTEVEGPVALRAALLDRPDQFVGTLTEKLLIYALGRGLEPFDMPVVRSIVGKARANDYRFSSLIMGIVNSAPFRMKRSQERAGSETAVVASQ